jgi:hypothetical protein
VLFGRRGSCAVRVEQEPEEVWQIGAWQSSKFVIRAKLPGGSRAVGVMRESNGRVALIALDRDEFRLHFIDGSNELLFTAPDRLVSYTVCPNTSLVAMLTEKRQLIVVSAATRDVRLSVQTGRGADAVA